MSEASSMSMAGMREFLEAGVISAGRMRASRRTLERSGSRRSS